MSKVAFVFPGQGSQFPGMLSELADVYPTIYQVFQTASKVLGYDLWDIVQHNLGGQLDQTVYTQPALLASGYALWQLWNEQGGTRPDFMAGHSLGEYTALVCSGSLSFEAGITLVQQRAKFMQEAVQQGEGAMAALLGLALQEIFDVCKESSKATGLKVSAANLNAPGQIVIAGHTAAVNHAVELAKSKGAKRAVILPVSVPSHCDLMESAALKMANVLQSIVLNAPTIPVIHNVDVTCHANEEEIKTALVQQLYKPVRWIETIEYLSAQGVQTIVECGPGKVLTGLIKRIDKSVINITMGTLEELSQSLDAIKAASVEQ